MARRRRQSRRHQRHWCPASGIDVDQYRRSWSDSCATAPCVAVEDRVPMPNPPRAVSSHAHSACSPRRWNQGPWVSNYGEPLSALTAPGPYLPTAHDIQYWSIPTRSAGSRGRRRFLPQTTSCGDIVRQRGYRPNQVSRPRSAAKRTTSAVLRRLSFSIIRARWFSAVLTPMSRICAISLVVLPWITRWKASRSRVVNDS